MGPCCPQPRPVVDWILACRNDDGGFGSFPGDISGLRPTYWALSALGALGVRLGRPEAVARFIGAQQNQDGGFRGRPWGLRWTEKSTLADSYHAVGALHELGFGVPRAAELAAFVSSRQRPDGAFLQDLYPETAGVCRETYYAVSMLRALGVEIPRARQLADFLRGMQDRNVRQDGGFVAEDSPDWQHLVEDARAWAASTSPYRDPGAEAKEAIPVAVGYIWATFSALETLRLLGEAPRPPEAAVAFLALQQHPSGGFATGMRDYGAYHDGSKGRMSDTYCALARLAGLLGEEGDGFVQSLSDRGVDVGQCGAWIVGCQNADAGFARCPDPASRPSDMAATAQAVLALLLLGRPVRHPPGSSEMSREELPPGAGFDLRSPFFQPDQPGQALYLHRIVAPVRAAHRTDEAVALGLMRWVNEHLEFGANSRNEAALIVEDEFGACGPQARCLAGLLEAVGIPARFLMVRGHCTCEAFIDGRWCLLDVMFQGAFRRKDGGLSSALDVHEQHRAGGPEITTFGDWRYESFTIYWPKGGPDYTEIEIKAEDSADSPAARRAYPELSAG
jgi:hypothetical protein